MEWQPGFASYSQDKVGTSMLQLIDSLLDVMLKRNAAIEGIVATQQSDKAAGNRMHQQYVSRVQLETRQPATETEQALKLDVRPSCLAGHPGIAPGCGARCGCHVGARGYSQPQLRLAEAKVAAQVVQRERS